MCLLPLVHLHGVRRTRHSCILQRGLLCIWIYLHLRYNTPSSYIFLHGAFIPQYNQPHISCHYSFILIICCHVFYIPPLRLCIGHHVPCAMLPFPHVCCQTAHSHDAELPWNPGKTLLTAQIFLCSTTVVYNTGPSQHEHNQQAFTLPHPLH